MNADYFDNFLIMLSSSLTLNDINFRTRTNLLTEYPKEGKRLASFFLDMGLKIGIVETDLLI